LWCGRRSRTVVAVLCVASRRRRGRGRGSAWTPPMTHTRPTPPTAHHACSPGRESAYTHSEVPTGGVMPCCMVTRHRPPHITGGAGLVLHRVLDPLGAVSVRFMESYTGDVLCDCLVGVSHHTEPVCLYVLSHVPWLCVLCAFSHGAEDMREVLSDRRRSQQVPHNTTGSPLNPLRLMLCRCGRALCACPHPAPFWHRMCVYT
jgi:hypothetical protein